MSNLARGLAYLTEAPNAARRGNSIASLSDLPVLPLADSEFGGSEVLGGKGLKQLSFDTLRVHCGGTLDVEGYGM